MNVKANLGTQGALVAAITYVQGSQVPEGWRVGLTVGLAILMTFLSLLNHYYNPDGTSAKGSWKG
ncbi:MAG: hypothetical protein JRI39_00280, partial [Deltaproteobacteria bacterium]|nr:hypothetical protein [Deltaproteobacteria bacterium]